MSHLRTELTQRHAAATPPPPADEPDEDEEQPADEHPPTLAYRVPVFGRRFRASAQGVPDAVHRAAVVLASRIAAGDETAFRGTRRIERDRELCRQRVGRDYRLFFRMREDELEVLDQVRRKDLERSVRELTRG